MGVRLTKSLKIFPIETARGCLYNCAFCSEVHYWGKPTRYKSINKVVDDLKQNVDKYQVKTFRFTDSCFTAPVERCMDLCDAIYTECINNKYDIKWTSYARVNNLTDELLEKMKRSGCPTLLTLVMAGVHIMAIPCRM